MKNLTKKELVNAILKIDKKAITKGLIMPELEKLLNAVKNPVSQVNEKTIRSQKVSDRFQRFIVVVGMLKDGHHRTEILERLMSENGIYAGINKAMSEKSTKNFIGKVVACYNGLTGNGKAGKVSAEMTRLKDGFDVSETCTFKSYARLTYKASL